MLGLTRAGEGDGAYGVDTKAGMSGGDNPLSECRRPPGYSTVLSG